MKKSKILITIILIWIAIVMVFNAKNIFLEEGNLAKINTSASVQSNDSGKGLIIVADDLVKENMDATIIKNNTERLQNHVDTVSNAGGGTVHIPAGTYYFASSGANLRNVEEYVILCKDNVIIEGEGNSESSGTILVPYGTVSLEKGGMDMFYHNQYEDSNFTDPDFLENADFKDFVIDGGKVLGGTYNSSGKGFMINLFKNCDWENVTVKNTDGTGFGIDCPINSTVKNCKAINCGKAVENESAPRGSGFGIGTGYRNDESIHISDCTATNNGKFGFFFEHQAKFSNVDLYGASTSEGFVVSNCTAQNNMYDFGGLRANDVTYENCISTSTASNSPKNKLSIYFAEHSKRTHVANFKISRIFDDVTDNSTYYYEPTYWAIRNAITTGVSTEEFAPNNESSKAQVITSLWKFAERPGNVDYGKESEVASNYEGLYNDVIGTDSYAEAIKWAKEEKIIDNMTNFEPNSGCTRAMFVEYLWKFAGSPNTSKSYTFTDVPAGASYKEAINWAISKDIITGRTETTFDPDEVCKRAEIVTFLYRYYKGNNNFQITYNLNGGTVATSNNETYTAGTNSFILNNPTKTGYTFEGWTGSNGTTPQKTVKISTNDIGHKVYTANWVPNDYTVTFNSNGGTGTMITESFTYDVPQLLSKNVYSKTGYDFSGWDTSVAGTGNLFTDENAVDNLTSTADGNVTLYAQWSARSINYTVNHYMQNVDGTYPTTATETETIPAAADVTVTPNTKSYTGFKSPTKQTATVNADGTTVINYYYERNLYTVAITKGKGIKDVSGAGTYRYGETVALDFEIEEGYKSWSWNMSGIGEGDYNDDTNSFAMPANNVSIDVFVTELFYYEITYNLNGGTENTNPITYTVESADITLNAPTKEGYEFLGWTGSNGSEPEKTVTITAGSTGEKSYTANWNSLNATTYEYKVEHYRQNLDGTYSSTPTETDYLETNNQTVTPNRRNYTGFIMPEAKTVTLNTGNIEVIKYYYERSSYTVTITKGKGIKEVTGAGTYRYGETVSLTFELEPGYKGWSWTIKGIGDDDYDEETDSFAMPATNVSIDVYITSLFEYTISYNLNGGIGNANPSTYNVESSDIVLNAPTREGYEFLGWTGSNGTSPQKEVSIPAGSTGNRTYVANWEIAKQTTYTYMVEHFKQGLDGNYTAQPEEVETFETTSLSVVPATKYYEGFTAPEKETVTLDANNVTTITYLYERNSYTIETVIGKGIKSVTGDGAYKYGQPVNMIFELADGYNGYGCYMTGITEEYFNEGSFNMPANNIVFEIAATSMYTYTITYNLNGGTLTNMKTTYNVETSIILGTPTREGYEFLGWTGSNGTVPQKEVTINVGTTGNQEYTANWKQITQNTYTYMVEHFKQGLDGNYIADPDEVETFETTEAIVKPNTKVYEGFTAPEKETVTLDANKTTVITYLYERNSYTIETVIGKGIKSVTGDGTYKYGQTVNMIIELADGYNGYEILMSGISKEYYNNGTFNMPANNITFEIKANSMYTYIITYNLNGGILTGGQTSFNVETTDFILPQPTKEGYEFLGWTGSNGTVPQKEVTIKVGTTENQEYIANWKSLYTTYLYKVEHYKQGTDGKYSNIPDEVEEFETTDATVTPDTKVYEGFIIPNKQTVSLEANNTVVIKYQYERKLYTVNIEKGNGIAEITGNGTYRYGQEVIVTIVPTEGYENINYNINGIEKEKFTSGKFFMPNNNITVEVSATISTYTITYNLSGGTLTGEQTSFNVETTDFVLPEPTKEGYEFLGWIGSNGEEPQKQVVISEGSTGNREYKAVWKSENVKYAVEHYKQNLYGEFLKVPDEKQEFEAEYGSTVTPDTKNYEGFAAPKKQTVTIDNTGDTLIKYYYIRNYYEVKIKTKNGISNVISEGKYLYGEKFTLYAIQADGYDVVSWKIQNNGEIHYYIGPSLYLEMPANEIIIEVEAERDLSDIIGNTQPVYLSCKVEHYLQNIDGTYPETPIENEIQTTIIGSSVNAKTKTYEGFTAPKAEILRSGVIKYYYTRNSYTLNITKGPGIKGASEGNIYKYNQEISLNATTMEGYENIKWIVKTDKEEQKVEENGISFNMPASDVNVEITATPIIYTITYNLDSGKENTNPNSYTIESKEIKLSNPTREGYEFLGWTGSNGETPQKDVIIPKGSTGNKEYIANWKKLDGTVTPPEENDKVENPEDDNKDNNQNDDQKTEDNSNNNNNNNNNHNDNNNNGNDNVNNNESNNGNNDNQNNNNNLDNNEDNNKQENNNQNSNSQGTTENKEETSNNNDKVVIENPNLTNTEEPKTNSSNKESVTKDDLPKAGKEKGIIVLIILAASFGFISLKKYLKYKDY